MFKKLGLRALALGLAMATVTPTIGFARDHDRDDQERAIRHERPSSGNARGISFAMITGTAPVTR